MTSSTAFRLVGQQVELALTPSLIPGVQAGLESPGGALRPPRYRWKGSSAEADVVASFSNRSRIRGTVFGTCHGQTPRQASGQLVVLVRVR